MLDIVRPASTTPPPSTTIGHGGAPTDATEPTETSATELEPIVYIHGGGFVAVNSEILLHSVACPFARNGRTVYSIDYPLSPEAPFPAAVVAALAAVSWVAARTRCRSVVLVGDSAGGAIASLAAALISDAALLRRLRRSVGRRSAVGRELGSLAFPPGGVSRVVAVYGILDSTSWRGRSAYQAALAFCMRCYEPQPQQPAAAGQWWRWWWPARPARSSAGASEGPRATGAKVEDGGDGGTDDDDDGGDGDLRSCFGGIRTLGDLDDESLAKFPPSLFVCGTGDALAASATTVCARLRRLSSERRAARRRPEETTVEETTIEETPVEGRRQRRGRVGRDQQPQQPQQPQPALEPEPEPGPTSALLVATEGGVEVEREESDEVDAPKHGTEKQHELLLLPGPHAFLGVPPAWTYYPGLSSLLGCWTTNTRPALKAIFRFVTASDAPYREPPGFGASPHLPFDHSLAVVLLALGALLLMQLLLACLGLRRAHGSIIIFTRMAAPWASS